MASLPQDLDHDSSTFSPKIPHFFKIITYGNTSYKKLRIPMKFMMKYGDDVSDSVLVKLPCGTEWRVEVTRCNGEVWLDKGWSDFSNFYSLQVGHFLVFAYDGSSKFRVSICDRTATEIEYPIRIMPQTEVTDSDNDEDSEFDPCDAAGDDSNDDSDDDSFLNSVEILDNFSPSLRKTREKSPLPCPRPHKKRRKSSSHTKAEITDYDCVEILGHYPSCPKTEDEYPLKPRSSTKATIAKAKAFARAKDFRSKNPFFKVFMHHTYIYSRSMDLPRKFIKAHLKRAHVYATLRVSDGRTWVVKVDQEAKGKTRFKGGWLKFVRGNNLEVGDVCVFVLVDNTNPLFDVVFYPTTKSKAAN